MNLKNVKFFRILMLFGFMLLSLLMIPTPLVYAPDRESHHEIPGMSENIMLCNLTDVTPTRLMKQIASNKMYAYAFKNVTLLMNCSKNSKLNITIESNVQTRYLALIMEQNKSALLNMNISVAPPPGVMTMEQTLNFYWGIEPNTTLRLQAQLRLHINGTALHQQLNREVDTSKLTWMYWNKSESNWIPVKSHIDEDGYLTCNTTHFSTWTVAEINPQTTPWMTYGITSVTMGAIIASVLLIKRR